MLLRGIRTAAVVGFAINVFLITSYNKAAEVPPERDIVPAVPTIEQLSAACRSAKTAFAPRTQADLQAAKDALVAAVGELDAKLKAAGPEGGRWKAFLRWDQMQGQLARDEGPDLTELDTVYARYASGHQGLDLLWFLKVRQGLRRYLTTARAIDNAELQKQYEGLLDALPGYLEAYQSHPTTEGAAVIGDAVEWLEEAGQAPELIQAIRSHFSRPNLFLQLSIGVIDAGIAETIDETGRIADFISGASVTGTRHTVGRIYAELLPNDQFAEITTVFRGTINSQTVATSGPARVTSEGDTRVASRKTLRVNAEQVWTLPARARAETEMTIKNVQTLRGGARVAQTAQQQVYAQKPQSERDTALRAAQEAVKRMDERGDADIALMNDDYQKKFRKPLINRGLFPQQFHFRSTAAAVHATGLHGGLAGLGGSGPPPAIDGEYDLAVRLHESALNNFLAAALPGMIMQEETFRTQVTDLLGSTPKWLEPDEESAPWTITYSQRQPISCTFADGGFIVTLRGRSYARGETTYPGMSVTAVYKIQGTDEGLKALRQGELKIFPLGFTPGEQLSTRQQVLRSLLEKRFGKMFQEELIPDPLVLRGAWEKAGELELVHWKSSDGWMVLGWNRKPPQAAAAATLPAQAAP